MHRLAEHDPADVGRQVAPADADDLRHADAGRVEQAGRLLGAGAGGGDDADRAGGDDVREAEADVAEHRGPAAGTHDEQPQRLAALLELELVVERDVVGEEEDVHAGAERAVRFERRVLAGDGDDRDVGVVEPAARGDERARRLAVGPCRAAAGSHAATAGELLLGGASGLLGDVVAARVDRDDEIRRAGARHLDAARLERLEIGRRAHAHLAAVDAVAAAQARAMPMSFTLSA